MPKLNTTETLATLTALALRWPRTFWVLETRRRPLKVGIHLDIMAAGGFSEPELRAALRAYTVNAAYRRNLVAGAERIGLDGQPAGTVTAEQEQHEKAANAGHFRRVRGAKPPAPKPTSPPKPAAHPLFPETLKLKIGGSR